MFSFHKPRVYRSTEGCCICRAKSSSSRFTDSKKYENDSIKCFNLDFARQGEICNACVLLVKRFKRLPTGSNRHWGHVVDARIGPGMKSMTKFKKLKEESMQQQQNTLSEKHSQNNGKLSSIPEKFCKIFKKNKKKLNETIKKTKHNREGTPGSWDEEQSLPPTPESMNSDNEELQYNKKVNNNRLNRAGARINRRKIKHPIKYGKRRDTVEFFDDKDWHRIKSCCGTAYENSRIGALLIDCQTCTPCAEHIKPFFKTEIETTNKMELSAEIQPYVKNTVTSQELSTAHPIIKKEENNSKQALKKHHLFFKRQLENFPAENYSNNSYKTDSDSKQLEFLDSVNVKTNEISTICNNKNSFLHKIKSETGKVVKHSLDKINTIRLKPKDVSDVKNFIKVTENLTKHVSVDKMNGAQKSNNVKVDPSATKFSDNSSDSGFDENLQDQKPTLILEHQEKKRKLIVRPVQTMYLPTGIQVQSTQANLILSGNDSTKILQSTRPQNGQICNKIAQNSGSHKVRAILNPNLIEDIVSITGNANPQITNNVTPSITSLNQKIVYLKTKYNNNNNKSLSPNN